MSAEHKRPFFAFVVVALICGLVVGNALRSEAFRSVLRTAASNVVSSTSLVHAPASEAPLVDRDDVDVVNATVPGKRLARSRVRGHAWGLMWGPANAGNQDSAKGQGETRDGKAAGHERAHQGGHAKGLAQGRSQGEAKGLDKAQGRKAAGHARAHQGGHAKGLQQSTRNHRGAQRR